MQPLGVNLVRDESLRLPTVGAITAALEVELESAGGHRANEYAEESKNCRRHPSFMLAFTSDGLSSG